MISKNIICVCYLVRFRKGKKYLEDINSFNNFYKSYHKYKAGAPHKLFILIKGPFADISLDIIKKTISKNISIIKLNDEGYDLGSFTEFARYRGEDFMFILNQHSIILTNNWLQIYHNAQKKTKSKVVATTASKSSFSDPYYINPAKLKDKLKNNLKKIKAMFYKHSFFSYPNPHIRTNGLFIKTNIWLEYFKDLEINSKFQCHQIESGKKSFYNFLKKNYTIAIVNKKGQYVTNENEWKNFVPFRNKIQISSLIISDNQTRYYENSSNCKKKQLELESWR